MKIIKKFLVLLGVLIALFVCFIIFAVILPGLPTKGDKIEQYQNPQKALLIIDIQEDFTGKNANPAFKYPQSEKFIRTVNNIIKKASAKGMKIVYIRQEFDGVLGTLVSRLFLGGAAIKGGTGTVTDKRILKMSKYDFTKPQSDAFSNPALNEFLIKNKVNELYLAGLDAAYCVNATARGARNRNYKVNLINDAVTTLEPDKWQKLLKEYKEEGIKVISSQDL